MFKEMAQVTVGFHALVQDTDDLDAGRRKAVVDAVMADTQTPVTRADVPAVAAETRIAGEGPGALVQLIKIVIGLLDAPALEGVAPNHDEIVFGGCLLIDFIHGPGSIRPLAWPAS
jgi:hypothetical protein